MAKFILYGALVLGIIGGIPSAGAVEAPKLQGISSVAEPVKQSKRAKRQRNQNQCYDKCIEECFWYWFCENSWPVLLLWAARQGLQPVLGHKRAARVLRFGGARRPRNKWRSPCCGQIVYANCVSVPLRIVEAHAMLARCQRHGVAVFLAAFVALLAAGEVCAQAADELSALRGSMAKGRGDPAS